MLQIMFLGVTLMWSPDDDSYSGDAGGVLERSLLKDGREGILVIKLISNTLKQFPNAS